MSTAEGPTSQATARGVVCASYGGPEAIALGGITTPAPGPGQVLVKLGAAGINPSDAYVVQGPAGPYAGTKLVPELPFTPGKDGAGVVQALGPPLEGQPRTFALGDRVYVCGSLTGTHAELALCQASQVFPLPPGTTVQQGACVGVPCGTAYKALVMRGAAKAGEWVLIHGASGAVGLAATQLAVSLGCRVVGTAGTEAGEAAVKAAGAHLVVNHRQDGYLKTAKEATRDQAGFDLCLEMMASSNLANDLTVMASYGRVAVVGSKAAPIPINPRAVMPLELDIRGVFLGNTTPDEVAMIHQELYKAMDSGALRPVVALEVTLEEASKAYAEIVGPSAGGSRGNVVISIDRSIS